MANRLYIGNLPMDIRKGEIDDLFYKYGRIVDIDIKNTNRPPAFAFISFDDSRDADDAIRGRDGYMFDGNRLRVERSRGSRGGRDDRRNDDRGRQIRGPGRRSEWGCVITKLPKSASWQDLKDFMRKAGDVIYADVDRDGTGTCEFSNEDDMHNAVRKLDDTEFRNRYDSSYVRVELARDSRRSRSRSRSRDRSRSRSRGRSRSRSPSRSRSRSNDRHSRSRSRSNEKRSRSRSRSRSESPRDRDRSRSKSRSKSRSASPKE